LVDGGARGGGGADGGEQGARHFGFVEAGDGAESLRDFLREFIDPHGDGDDAAGGAGHSAANVCGGHAIGDGHVKIHDENVGIELGDEAKSFGVVSGFTDEFDIVGGFEEIAEGAAHGVEIVGDDDADGHGTVFVARGGARQQSGDFCNGLGRS
jgi:hypothetical protein